MRILAELKRRIEAGERCALVTVVDVKGSSPAQSAMRMLVGREGRIAGSVGGGRIEAEAEEQARSALRDGKARLFGFTLDDDLADEGGLICGGIVTMLAERVDPPASWAGEAIALLEQGRRGALVARIGEKVERSVLTGEEARPFLAEESPRLEEATFVEPLLRPRCIVLGGGHVGRSVARVAAEAGFYVAVVEDRADHAARLEADRVVVAPHEEGLRALRPGPDDYIVITTRAHGLDRRCALEALRTEARYVGMLGSRKKTATVVEALARDGIPAERLHAPIGLDLGGVSAGEIAVSVVAQMIKVRRKGRGDR